MENNTTLTREKIDTLKALSKENTELSELTSESLRTAQDRFNDRKHKITRNGAEVEIDEKTLWVETYHLGMDSEAGKLLQSLHPQVFEHSRKQNVVAANIKKFLLAELGIVSEQITISDYLRLSEDLINLMMDERAAKAKPQSDEDRFEQVTKPY